ncbi:alpha/beta hydrolase [Mycobacterium sp. NPDC051198]
MALDPDAAAIADALSAMLPGPMHTLGIEGARAVVAGFAAQSPPPPPLHSAQDRVIDGPGGPLPLRVYRPGPGDRLPVLVYLHGGGWAMGNLDGSEALCRTLSAKAGCVVVSVDYRLAPEHKFPAAVDDGFAALQWVADHVGEIGGDANRIAIGGDSAGANLSAAITILARDHGGPPIAFQLLAYPVTEYAVERPSWHEHASAPLLTTGDVLWFWDQYLRDQQDRQDPRATPSNATTLVGLPPAFILTAEYDPVRDDAEHYGDLLHAAGVEVTVKRYPGVFHTFLSLVGVLNRTSEALDDAAAQLTRIFEAESSRAGR